jgi:Homeodomain-like domain-containing protein
MPNRVRILTVTDADRARLERRARDRGAEARVAERARIVLLAAEGLTGPQIAERVGYTEPTVIKCGGSTPRTAWPGWRTRPARAARGPCSPMR